MVQMSLKAARVNAGLSSKDVANIVGLNFQTILKYEKDSTDITTSLLSKLCSIYQIPEDYIFLGKEYDIIRTIEINRKKQEV